MQIDQFKHEENWQDIKDAAMNTINKTTGKYPDSVWKRKLILSEHSPIRRMKFYWRWKDLKSWVSVHMVRHKIGIEHWVSTQRSDRTGVSRDELPQGALVNHACEADAQALINISRKRLCSCASPETREAWQLVREEVAKTEPELASCMVRECITGASAQRCSPAVMIRQKPLRRSWPPTVRVSMDKHALNTEITRFTQNPLCEMKRCGKV